MLTARMIGYKVREARQELGWTQKQLAQMAGVSERFLISLELGDSKGVTLEKLQMVLGVLGLELSLGKAGESGAGSVERGPRIDYAYRKYGVSAGEGPEADASASGRIDALALLLGEGE